MTKRQSKLFEQMSRSQQIAIISWELSQIATETKEIVKTLNKHDKN